MNHKHEKDCSQGKFTFIDLLKSMWKILEGIPKTSEKSCFVF